jgi:Tfp pilus assembly protein FimT
MKLPSKALNGTVSSFTTIELIMIIVIIGILAISSIPGFRSFYAIKLEGSVKKW